MLKRFMTRESSVTNSTDEELRYEFKLIVPRNVTAKVYSWLKLNPVGIRTQWPDRLISSVYFDSFEHDLFIESEQGLESREKYRLRWYGDDLNPTKSQFERKRKFGILVGKSTSVADGLVRFDGTEKWIDVMARVSELHPNYRVMAANMRPSVAVRYSRQYFTSLDNLVRVTVDSSIRSFDMATSGSPKWDRPTLIEDDQIIEVKSSVENEQIARQLVSSFPVRPSRNSKFVNARTQTWS